MLKRGRERVTNLSEVRMFEEGKVPAVITEFLVVKFREVAGSAEDCRLLSLKCPVED